MTSPLPPVPNPEITPGKNLTPPWQSWFYQLYTYLTATVAGGGGLVPTTTQINTTAPLSGGGDLSANRTLSILTNGITNALLAQMPTLTIKGNNTGATNNALDLTATQVKAMLGISLSTDVTGTLQAAQMPILTGDVTTPGASLATTIAANVVSNSKLAQMPTLTIKGNNTGGTANALDLTASQVKTLLAISLNSDVTGTLQAAQEPAHTGEVTNAAGSLALVITRSTAFTWTGNHLFNPSSGVPIQTTGANVGIIINSTGATAPLKFVPSGQDNFQIGAGMVAVSDFGIQNVTRGTTPLSISGGATGGNITIAVPGAGQTLTLAPSPAAGELIATSAALTNGSGASAGTITNAPSVGNPTKWIKINDNGTIRAIPAW